MVQLRGPEEKKLFAYRIFFATLLRPKHVPRTGHSGKEFIKMLNFLLPKIMNLGKKLIYKLKNKKSDPNMIDV